MGEQLLTTIQVAEMLRLKSSYLEQLRHQGKEPTSIKLGYRTVRYAPSAVQAWLEASDPAARDASACACRGERSAGAGGPPPGYAGDTPMSAAHGRLFKISISRTIPSPLKRVY